MSDLVPVVRPGTLSVADRVYDKIAARVAAEVADVAALAPRLADRLPGRQVRRVDARVVRSGDTARVRVSIAVAYPVPVVRVARGVRAHLQEKLGRLCDVEVREVDVHVVKLVRPPAVRMLT